LVQVLPKFVSECYRGGYVLACRGMPQKSALRGWQCDAWVAVVVIIMRQIFHRLHA
jgi:hypothetical protein